MSTSERVIGIVAAIVTLFAFVTGVHSLKQWFAADGRSAALSPLATPTPSLSPGRAGTGHFGADLDVPMNAALVSQYGDKYRVATDKDLTWTKYDLDTFIMPNRKTFKHYPYIVIGDFDGDKVSDLAALVRNSENNYLRLAVLWGGKDKLTFYDGQLCWAISFVPANEWKSRWERASVTLPADAILVECYEKSSWLLYWNGRSFQQYWMTD